MPGAANPQAFNRYSYVLNNPLRYNDPTGHYHSAAQDTIISDLEARIADGSAGMDDLMAWGDHTVQRNNEHNAIQADPIVLGIVVTANAGVGNRPTTGGTAGNPPGNGTPPGPEPPVTNDGGSTSGNQQGGQSSHSPDETFFEIIDAPKVYGTGPAIAALGAYFLQLAPEACKQPFACGVVVVMGGILIVTGVILSGCMINPNLCKSVGGRMNV